MQIKFTLKFTSAISTNILGVIVDPPHKGDFGGVIYMKVIE
jgi:hypothetical protein